MELYLIKSAVILTIFYGFYKLVLENESMHVFKRFYLLGALGISFLIPLITFTTYVEMPSVTTSPVFMDSGTIFVSEMEESVNYWPYILWGLYALGVLYFSFTFGKNLKQLVSRIKNNPKLKQDAITHVLLKKNVIPHTFLSYVFLNKQKYEAQEIPDAVLQHEHIHAKQKHSIDILLVELVQIVFWFNPLLYFIKGSIKLNHEFLADSAVLKRGISITAYQQLLLAFSSNAITPTLANSINYSFIKKRFTVMKKQTSTKAIWLRTLIIVPLLAVVVYGFSTEEKIIIKQEKIKLIEEGTKNLASEYNNPEIIEISDSDIVEHLQIHVNSDEEFTLNGYKTTINTLGEQLKRINPNLTKEDKTKRVIAHIYSHPNTKMGFINDIRIELINNGIHRFVSHPLEKKNNVETLIPQEQATKAELQEYNTLAKKYNAMNRNNVKIFTAEVDRMKFIYNKMTVEQKENAQPFPYVLPAQPPTPPAPKVGKTSSMQSAPEVPTIYTVPQPPPAPNDDPIEYIKELTKAGAMFYIGPHRYSSAEVIEIAKKSKDFKLDVSNYPKVNLPGC